jgi:hypothetical protein
MLFTQSISFNNMALRAVLAVLLRGVCHHGLRGSFYLKSRPGADNFILYNNLFASFPELV